MSVSDRVPPRSDAMPTTRGTNFYLSDPNLEFVCSTVMRAEDLARECGWLDAIVDWTPIPAEALAAVTAGQP
jgi:hypothetical protein